MTYNFDPERWRENQQRVLKHRLENGQIDETGFESGIEALERRYLEMVERLDGTYVIPGTRSGRPATEKSLRDDSQGD